MHLTDSHAHLDFYHETSTERLEVLRRAYQAGVETVLAIGIGEGPAEMHHALDLANEIASLPEVSSLPRVFASAGIHPEQAHQVTPEALDRLALLATNPRCLAIGEIGLDYYHFSNPDIATQRAAFVAQMQIAAAARKPILIHCRTSELATAQAQEKYEPADAWEDLLWLIAQHWTGLKGDSGQELRLGGVMHCFSGTEEQALRSIAAGFYLSFAGNLTYPRSQAIREAAIAAPADRILIETDCPFLAPIPFRGQRNEPALITHTAAALAELRGISPEELAAITTANFRNLFPSTTQMTTR